MPEEKAAPTPTSSFAATDTYKRVYPDWKPSTTLDVVSTIEAIEDAQPRTPRDKSAWRKSNLNVPNSSENTDSFLRLSRQRSREGTSSTANSPLQSIIEEDRRKNVIQQLGERPASDKLQIYIRRPSDSPEVDSKSLSMSSGSDAVTSDHHSIYIRPTNDIPPITTQPTSVLDTPNVPRRARRLTSSGTEDKIEIDSENIETPPSTRRNISAENKALSNPCRKLQSPRPLHRQTVEENSKRREEEELDAAKETTEAEPLGQFDRHSIARRTRRYKRPTDYSSGNEERGDVMPDTSVEKDTNKYSASKSKLEDDLDKITLPKIEDKDARLKRWQERLKSLDREDNPKLSPIQVLSRVGKVGRNISSINQEDVREAIRNLKSPTETPERVWSPPRDILKDKTIPTKSLNHHELNDEGFEETQSLVSDTPSHGKDSTSSNNEPTESKQRIRPLRMTSSDSAATTSSDTSRKKTITKPYVQSLLERNRQSLERSRSLRIAAAPTPIRSALVKRTNSLRKTDSQSSVTNQNRRDVERSSSRTSLRSSRSSLNSAASTNTVKNMPLKSQRSPVSIDKSVYKKPLVLQNNTTIGRITSRTPSRSSSSGSSIGPAVRRPPAKNTSSSSVSTSFKENQTTNKPSRSIGRSQSVTPHRLTSPPISSQISGAAAKVTSRLSTPPAAQSAQMGNGKIQRVSNFMRPTTASSTKFSGAKGK